jgi:hypothetical protein
MEDLMAEHSTKLAEMAKQLTSKSGVKVDFFYRTHTCHRWIASTSKALAGGSGSDGYEKLNAFDQRALGSTTTTVISQINFPILVVPEEATFSELKHIVYACKYSSLERSDNQLSLLRKLAITFDAQVRVLHIDQPPVAGEGMAISYKKHPNFESISFGCLPY